MQSATRISIVLRKRQASSKFSTVALRHETTDAQQSLSRDLSELKENKIELIFKSPS